MANGEITVLTKEFAEKANNFLRELGDDVTLLELFNSNPDVYVEFLESLDERGQVTAVRGAVNDFFRNTRKNPDVSTVGNVRDTHPSEFEGLIGPNKLAFVLAALARKK